MGSEWNKISSGSLTVLNTHRDIGTYLYQTDEVEISKVKVGNMIKRGDIFYADLRPVVGSEQGGIRPVLIIQNDVGNKHSPTVICAAITSQMHKAKLPTHIELSAGKYDLVKDSVILLEQLHTIDKKRLKDKVCHLEQDVMQKVERGLCISLQLHT